MSSTPIRRPPIGPPKTIDGKRKSSPALTHTRNEAPPQITRESEASALRRWGTFFFFLNEALIDPLERIEIKGGTAALRLTEEIFTSRDLSHFICIVYNQVECRYFQTALFLFSQFIGSPPPHRLYYYYQTLFQPAVSGLFMYSEEKLKAPKYVS